MSKDDSGDAPVAASPAESPTASPAPNADQPSAGGQAPAYPGTVLRQGSKGANVQTMQQRLSDLGYTLAVDSNFGPGTGRAVVAFQQKNNLGSDGMVGPATWAALWAG
jgi:peptidoglycan hydrolase-like protein with peptidoglycan-binding domain